MVGMKILLFLVLVGFTSSLFAQKRLAIETGKIEFTSNAALELINASAEKVSGLIDPVANTFAFIVNTRSFTGFNSSLQQQHFNEKYLETDKFYEATFTGNIIDPVDYTTNGVYKVRAKGSLVIHGKKQVRIIPGTITVANGTVTIDSNFSVPLSDHDITIPKIVNQKIATEILVKLKLILKEKAK
jgi:polyisoprenoid-binding protein YceI